MSRSYSVAILRGAREFLRVATTTPRPSAGPPRIPSWPARDECRLLPSNPARGEDDDRERDLQRDQRVLSRAAPSCLRSPCDRWCATMAARRANARIAGPTPKTTTVASVTRHGDPDGQTGQPDFVEARQIWWRDRQQLAGRAPHARHVPKAPAADAQSASLSINAVTNDVRRPAPSARRIAVSRVRLDDRMSSRLATLMHAISSRRAAAPESSSNAGFDVTDDVRGQWTWPLACSCRVSSDGSC